MSKSTVNEGERVQVGLFVTCVVDLFRPAVGWASVRLLERAGCQVEVPEVQVCCGQPAYNSGDRKDAIRIARQTIDAFLNFEYVVVPSGSCGGMVHKHYPELFKGDPEYGPKANVLAAKTWEITSFLTEVRGVESVEAAFPGTVTYHDSCAGLREMGVQKQPRKLLRTVEDLEFKELENAEDCCGFGGTFCVKYPEISTDMVRQKVQEIQKTGADLVLAGDLSCLLNIVGRLKREGSAIQGRHITEVLAGTLDTPAIGEGGE